MEFTKENAERKNLARGGGWRIRWMRVLLGFPAQDSRGNQRDQESDRERLEERHGGVGQGIVLQHFVSPDLLDFRLNGSGAGARGLQLLDGGGAILVHEVGHEFEVENFPGHDVAERGNKRNGDANDESFAERDESQVPDQNAR